MSKLQNFDPLMGSIDQIKKTAPKKPDFEKLTDVYSNNLNTLRDFKKSLETKLNKLKIYMGNDKVMSAESIAPNDFYGSIYELNSEFSNILNELISLDEHLDNLI